jgi:hypothetical protein
LPGRVVWFYMHLYTGLIAHIQPVTVVLRATVEQPPTNLSLNFVVSPGEVDDRWTLYSIKDASVGANLLSLVLEAQQRALGMLSRGIDVFDEGRQGNRAFAIPVELDLSAMDARQLVRPFGGVRIDRLRFVLLAHVHQWRFEHDRGHGLDLAVAIEHYITRERRIMAKAKNDDKVTVTELRKTPATFGDDPDILKNGVLFRLIAEPWVNMPDIEGAPVPAKQVTFRLPDWVVDVSNRPT